MTISNPKRYSDNSIQGLNYESLFSRLQAGHTLITGNSRLARVLGGQYSQWRINRGDRQWPSPDLLSWNLWLDRLWQAAGLQGIPGTGRAVARYPQADYRVAPRSQGSGLVWRRKRKSRCFLSLESGL